jgi:hypothetical protein
VTIRAVRPPGKRTFRRRRIGPDGRHREPQAKRSRAAGTSDAARDPHAPLATTDSFGRKDGKPRLGGSPRDGHRA